MAAAILHSLLWQSTFCVFNQCINNDIHTTKIKYINLYERIIDSIIGNWWHKVHHVKHSYPLRMGLVRSLARSFTHWFACFAFCTVRFICVMWIITTLHVLSSECFFASTMLEDWVFGVWHHIALHRISVFRMCIQFENWMHGKITLGIMCLLACSTSVKPFLVWTLFSTCLRKSTQEMWSKSIFWMLPVCFSSSKALCRFRYLINYNFLLLFYSILIILSNFSDFIIKIFNNFPPKKCYKQLQIFNYRVFNKS